MSLDSEGPLLRTQLIQSLRNLREVQRAYETAVNAVEVFAYNADLNGNLLILGLLTDNLDVAANAFEAAARLSENQGPHASNFANFIREHRSLDDALSMSENLTNEFSDNPISLNLRGEMLLRQNEVAEAIEVLERAFQRKPNDSGLTRDLVNADQNRNNRFFATSQGLAPHQLSISDNKIIESCEESFSALNERRDNLFKK